MRKVILLIFMIVFFVSTGHASPIIIQDVPSYTQHVGCSPTAAAMLFGYWDYRGYENLFASAGDDLFQTPEVYQEIEELGEYMGTGQYGLSPGYTYTSMIPYGSKQFATSKGYEFEAQYISNTWQNFTAEIDDGNPVKLGVPGHSIIGLGYDEQNDSDWFVAAYYGYSEQEHVRWIPFSDITNMMSLHAISELDGTGFDELPSGPGPTGPAPIPEPATIILLTVGLSGIILSQRRR